MKAVALFGHVSLTLLFVVVFGTSECDYLFKNKKNNVAVNIVPSFCMDYLCLNKLAK